MSAMREVLVGRHGSLTGLLTRLAVLFAGGAVVFMSAIDLREAARLQPKPLTCSEWLAAPLETRWVSLSGCHLDLGMAASRRWKGFWFKPLPDGGSRAHLLELFVPLSATDTRELPVRAVVATGDAVLLASLDELMRLDVDTAAVWLEEHRDELQAKVEPERVTGYVEPIASVASRTALKEIDAEGAAVLQEGREPPRADGIFGLLLGVGLAVGALWTPVRRLRALQRGETLDEEDETVA